MLKFCCISYPRRQALRGDCVAVLLLFLEFLNERERKTNITWWGCSLFFCPIQLMWNAHLRVYQVESSRNRFELACSFQTALIFLDLFNSFSSCTLSVVSVVCVVQYLLHRCLTTWILQFPCGIKQDAPLSSHSFSRGLHTILLRLPSKVASGIARVSL